MSTSAHPETQHKYVYINMFKSDMAGLYKILEFLYISWSGDSQLTRQKEIQWQTH